jgi:hypothetical protein
MENNYSYTYEKLYNTIQALATWKWDIRERLKNAYRCLHTLRYKEDFPDELLKDWKFVINSMTKYKAEYEREWSIDCTMRKIKRKTWEKIAKMIFHIREKIHQIYYHDF